MAQIFNRAATTDNLLILGVRESAVQPFSAPGWTDLRIGMFVSVTQTVNNDTPTGLAESFATNQTHFNPLDWMWIGIKDPSQNFPGTQGSSFIGFTNVGLLNNSVLQSSDLGYGTGTYYWCPNNSGTLQQPFIMSDGFVSRATGPSTIQPHFFQAPDPGNPAPSGYYTGMIGFRLTRPTSTSNQVTALIPTTGAHSSDMLWTNAPTKALLLANLDPWPTSVVTIGPVNFSLLPAALFCYFPFHLSRLRISAWGVLQFA